MEQQQASKHPSQTASYWRSLASNERAFARADMRRRGGTVESIAIHLKQAEQYEAEARRIAECEAGSDEWCDLLRQELGTGVHRDLFNRIVRAALSRSHGEGV